MARRLSARCVWAWCAPAAVGLTTLACGGAATAPSGRELVGAWGTSEVELIGLHAGAELRLPCTIIIIDDPIELGDADDFTARGRVDGPGLTAGSLPVVRLTGEVAGSHVTVNVPARTQTSAATYLLEAGVGPALEDEPECPL
jgi:hypothetical protein